MEAAIDRAVRELHEVSARLGVAPPLPLGDQAAAQLESVERARHALEPLLLPDDLLYFWSTWDLRTFAVLDEMHVHLCVPDEAVEQRRDNAMLEFPRIMLPLTVTQYSQLCLELDTPTLKGGRLFDYNTHGGSYLVGSGVVDALTLLSGALFRGYDPTGPRLENAYFGFSDERARANQMVEVPFNRGEWHANWLQAEGFDSAWLEPRGASHSIAEFEAARREIGPFRAFLQGQWTIRAGIGGSDIGILEDDSGSIVLSIPTTTPSAGLGPGRRIEIEVESTEQPQSPEPPWGPSSRSDTSAEESSAKEVMQRLGRALAFDPTLRVVAVRPLR